MRTKRLSHDKKCDFVPYIHTQLCRLEENRTRWLWCWIKWNFCIFSEEKKVLVCLKYESSLQLEKQKKERQQNPQNRQQLTEYFLAQTSCSPSIKMGGRIKEWGRIHNTWIINRFSSTAYGNSNTGREGGVGGHLRRISETGKVTKLSLE